MRLRRASLDDVDAIQRLLRRSYAQVLAEDYPPSVIVTVLPDFTRPNRPLIQAGQFFVVEEEGRMLGVGGWSLALPGGGRPIPGRANIRHVGTDPDALRRGVARMIVEAASYQAELAGATWLHCISTLTAVPFYRSMGFAEIGAVHLQPRPGIDFPAVAMRKDL